jgi:hypothetical protein
MRSSCRAQAQRQQKATDSEVRHGAAAGWRLLLCTSFIAWLGQQGARRVQVQASAACLQRLSPKHGGHKQAVWLQRNAALGHHPLQGRSGRGRYDGGGAAACCSCMRQHVQWLSANQARGGKGGGKAVRCMPVRANVAVGPGSRAHNCSSACLRCSGSRRVPLAACGGCGTPPRLESRGGRCMRACRPHPPSGRWPNATPDSPPRLRIPPHHNPPPLKRVPSTHRQVIGPVQPQTAHHDCTPAATTKKASAAVHSRHMRPRKKQGKACIRRHAQA